MNALPNDLRVYRAKRQYHRHPTLASARLLHIYYDMRKRCTNPLCPLYKRYGGRGITVCPEWLDNFETFQSWALANGYEEHLTLDRRDNNDGYAPYNCRWVTSQENSRNKGNNRVVFGKCVTEWADLTGIPANTLYSRLRLGWDSKKALFTPKGNYTRRKDAENGKAGQDNAKALRLAGRGGNSTRKDRGAVRNPGGKSAVKREGRRAQG